MRFGFSKADVQQEDIEKRLRDALNYVLVQYFPELADENTKPGDKLYKMENTLITSALDLLFKNDILNESRLLNELETYGLPMNRQELEELLLFSIIKDSQ